jgi:hypothetical protein
MKSFTFCPECIEKVIDGHCIPWNYDYKEYVFNDKFTDAHSIRIPQNAIGIMAILYGSNGIKDEYNRVYLENSGRLTRLYSI